MDEIINVALRADVGQYVAGLGQAAGATKLFGSTVDKVSDRISKVAAATKKGLHVLGGAGITLLGSLVGLTAGASGFEGEMRNVQSITKDTWATTLGFSADLLKFSRTSTVSAHDLAKGMYEIVSSGFAGADAVTIVEQSAKAASAGISDAATAAFSLTAALNAYGLGADQATNVSDTLFKTVDLGVLTFDQLAQGMGDWVSLAASAKIPLEDAAAALAGITRAGVLPDEASTSLARIITSILNPTEKMAVAIKKMGFESGIAMLQQMGLHDTVMNLGKAAGGSTDKIVKMFGDIRAGRGALALLTNGGRNYNNVVAGMGTASSRAGATQKAFAIQSRGLGAQLTMLGNQLKANSIQLGMYLTPLARFGVSSLNNVIKPLGMMPPALRGAGLGFVALIGTMMTGLAALALWKLKSSLLFATFKTSSLVIKGMASASRVLLGATSGVTNSLEIAAGKASKWKAVTFLAQTAASHLGTTVGKLALGMGIVAAAITAAVVAWSLWSNAVKSAKAHADEMVDTLMKTENLTTARGVDRAIDDVQRKLGFAKKASDHFGDSWGRAGMRAVQNLTWMSNDVEEAEARVRALTAAQAGLITTQMRWQNATANVNTEIIGLNRLTGDSGNQLKLTNDEVQAFAKSLGVDLSKGGDEGAAGIAKIAAAAIDASNAGIALGDNFGDAATKVIGMTAEAGKAARDFANTVKEAYQSSFDIVGKFSGSVIADFNKFKMESPKDAAGRSIKDSKGRVLPKEKVFTEGTFKPEDVDSFYKASFKQAQIFSKDLETAINDGLNPNLITKFMAAGPTEGGKLLHTMVTQSGHALETVANQYEATMQRMAVQTAELGRITALALNSPKDILTKDLPTAMKVAQHVMDQHGKGMEATFESVAKSAHLPVSVVEKIAKEFGITLGHVVKSFKDIPIAQELTNVLAEQMVNVDTPITALDQMIKNYMGGADTVKDLTRGVTAEMEAEFAKAHPGEKIKENLAIDMAMGQGMFKKGQTPIEMLKILMDVQGLNPKVTLEIIASWKEAKQLEGLLKTDKAPTKTMNMILKMVTDPSQTNNATYALILAASQGQISTKTLEFALSIMGTPEAAATLHEFRQEQNNPTDNKITFHVDGKDIEVDIGTMGKKFNDQINAAFNPKKKKTVTLHITTEIVHDGRTSTNITQVNPIFEELKKEAKKDPVNIKILADGSIQVTKDKLEEVTTKLANLKKNKGPLKIELIAGEGTENLKSDLKKISSDLETTTGKIWTVTIKTDTSGFHLPDTGTVTQGSSGPKTTPRIHDGAAFGKIIVMEEGGFVTEKRPKQAHIVKKPTVLFGEQGTGGEAFIPLAPSRRTRSMGLLAQVAKMFGMKITEMAVGGIIGDEAWQQAHLANIQHTMAGSASFAAAVKIATAGITDAAERTKAAQAALEEMAKTYKDVQMAAGTSAANQLAASGLVGDAWQNAAARIIQAAADTKDRWNNIWIDLWTKGKITSSTYFTYLKSQMAKVPAYSQEWLSLRDSIAEIAKSERQVKFEVGDISMTAYVAVLKKQMAATRKYSAEWKSIKDEIESIEKEHQDHIASIQDRAYAQHRIGTAEYLKDLQARLAATKKYSSEYMSILGQIDELQQSFKDPILNATNAIAHFGSTAPQGFAEVQNYFTHAIEAAKRYNADLAQLRQMGLDKNLLMQLMQAGPSAVPFMDAIIRGGQEAVNQTNQDQATLTALSGQTMAATLGGPGSVEGIRGAASQVTTYNQQQTLSIGSITVGAGNGVTATQIRTEIGAAFNTLTSELQKRNN